MLIHPFNHLTRKTQVGVDAVAAQLVLPVCEGAARGTEGQVYLDRVDHNPTVGCKNVEIWVVPQRRAAL